MRGTYAVHAEPWEAQASQWVYHPSIIETATGVVVWSPADRLWSLDMATWQSDARVHLRLRRFPGGHQPPFVVATVDCCARIAFIGDVAYGLEGLERGLRAALVEPFDP